MLANTNHDNNLLVLRAMIQNEDRARLMEIIFILVKIYQELLGTPSRYPEDFSSTFSSFAFLYRVIQSNPGMFPHHEERMRNFQQLEHFTVYIGPNRRTCAEFIQDFTFFIANSIQQDSSRTITDQPTHNDVLSIDHKELYMILTAIAETEVIYPFCQCRLSLMTGLTELETENFREQFFETIRKDRNDIQRIIDQGAMEISNRTTQAQEEKNNKKCAWKIFTGIDIAILIAGTVLAIMKKHFILSMCMISVPTVCLIVIVVIHIPEACNYLQEKILSMIISQEKQPLNEQVRELYSQNHRSGR